MPNEAGSGGVEVTGGGYARQTITWGAASGGSKANSSQISFPVATSLWGSVAGVGIYEGTTLLAYDALDAPKAVEVGDALIFNAGSVSVTAD